MTTYIHDHSDLIHCTAPPAPPRAWLRVGSRTAAFPVEAKQHPVAPSLQGTKQDECLFHDSLIESGGKLRARNPLATVGSLIVQLLLLMAVAVIPLFHTDPVPKRETLTRLYLEAPAAAGANPPKVQAPKPTSTYIPPSTVIPAPVHTTQEAPPPPVDTARELVGGVPGGVVGGVPGGVLAEVLGGPRSMPLRAKTAEPTPIKRIRVASRVAEGNLIHDVPPQYPPEAGRKRIEGTVVLMAVIGKDGSVQDVQLVSGLPLLAQAAVEAVKQWRYKPYLLNGEPVEIDSRITINFTLSKG